MNNVIICGGGIIGSAVSYYLALKGIKTTIVEQTGIACAASGKAGGFLARDWCDHSELGTLARASFDLHMQLAEQFHQCDYRRVDTLSVKLKDGKSTSTLKLVPSWIDGPVVSSSSIGNTTTTAQVHPYKLTNVFVDEAKRLVGSEVLIGSVQGLEKDETKVSGVIVDGKMYPADVVIIAMGPWTFQAAQWLDIPAITSRRAHSIVMRLSETDETSRSDVTPSRSDVTASRSDVTAHCLFTDTEFAGKEKREPEVYPRPDGTVYACGFSDHVTLPDNARDIAPNSNSCKKLKEICGCISNVLADAEVIAEQACYLPTPQGHLPLIGSVPNMENVYMAAGHTCWGILNAPATGKALAELIVDGQCTLLDLAPFAPANFM